MLITDQRSDAVRVAVYDKVNNKMVDYGWVDRSEANQPGLTISKFNWEGLIAQEAAKRGQP